MITREAKLLNGTKEQYQAIDDAIRTAQFIRNKAVRYWMGNQRVGKADLYTLCKDLAKEFGFALKLNSAARPTPVPKERGNLYLVFIVVARRRRRKRDIPSLKNIAVP